MQLLWFREFLISLQWCVIRVPSAKLLLYYNSSLVEEKRKSKLSFVISIQAGNGKRLVPLLSCFPLTFSWHFLPHKVDLTTFFNTFILHVCTQTPKQRLDVVVTNALTLTFPAVIWDLRLGTWCCARQRKKGVILKPWMTKVWEMWRS